LPWQRSGFSFRRIYWWRALDGCDVAAFEQVAANEIDKAQDRCLDPVSASGNPQQGIGNHGGKQLQADGIMVVAQERVAAYMTRADYPWRLPHSISYARMSSEAVPSKRDHNADLSRRLPATIRFPVGPEPHVAFDAIADFEGAARREPEQACRHPALAAKAELAHQP
jgi:hypothetical protein